MSLSFSTTATVHGLQGRKGKRHDGCVPPMFWAAMPVLAHTARRSGFAANLVLSASMMALSSSDFPVPAEPVKKMVFSSSTTMRRTACCSSLSAGRGTPFCVWAAGGLSVAAGDVLSFTLARAVSSRLAITDGALGEGGGILGKKNASRRGCLVGLVWTFSRALGAFRLGAGGIP